MNVSMQDSYNLMWKLGAVLSGRLTALSSIRTKGRGVRLRKN